MRISLEEASDLLIQGDVVAVPTETVYGLAASLFHLPAIEKIFVLKGRPAKNPLITHLSEKKQIFSFITELPPAFDALTKAFWPGPLTIVVPILPEKVPSLVRSDLPTAAFRVPSHPAALHLLKKTGPLVMPSANISGRPSATLPEHVESDFGKDFPVMDGGDHTCNQGMESTVVVYQDGQWQIIRQGMLTGKDLQPILGYIPLVASAVKDKTPLCPGQLYRHYAPQAALILCKQIVEHPSGTILGYSGRSYPKGSHVIEIGPIDSPEKVGKNLYSVLRQLDAAGIKKVFVDMDIPSTGLWATISERLSKAARK